MKLIVISSPDRFRNEAGVINQLFKLGLKHFHLRKPEWSPAQVEELIQQIQSEYHPRIVVHDHFQLAVAYRLGGIHFSDKTKPEMNQWSSFEGSQSTSCHSLEELAELPEQLDYAFLSPVFPSISKEGYSPELEAREIRQYLRSHFKHEVIALGGIDPENIATCRRLGFNGVAALGFVWPKGRPEEVTIKHFLRLKRAAYRLYKQASIDEL